MVITREMAADANPHSSGWRDKLAVGKLAIHSREENTSGALASAHRRGLHFLECIVFRTRQAPFRALANTTLRDFLREFISHVRPPDRLRP